MSGGHFDYKNDSLEYALYEDLDVTVKYDLDGGDWYDESIEKVKEQDIMQDKELSELLYDVMCLLNSLDYYLSGDIGWATYEMDTQFFKEKWLRYHIPQKKEPPPPEEPKVEEVPLPMNPPKKKINHGKVACRQCWYYYHQWPNPDYFCRFHGGEFVRKVELQKYQRRPEWCPIINDEEALNKFDDFMTQKDEDDDGTADKEE